MVRISNDYKHIIFFAKRLFLAKPEEQEFCKDLKKEV